MKLKYVVVVAGGRGLRMGTTIPKQFLLLNGKPVLMHTIEAFYRYDPNIHIILVLPKEQKTYWHSLCRQYNFVLNHQITEGGESRFHSVKNSLRLVKANCLVAIHDGVRPLVTNQLISNAFEATEKALAVYPAIPIIDTLRQITNENNRVVNRSEFYLVQTPQVFLSDVLIAAYETVFHDIFTDDISVVEACKMCVPVMIEGCRNNIKITTSIDLLIAKAIIGCTWI